MSSKKNTPYITNIAYAVLFCLLSASTFSNEIRFCHDLKENQISQINPLLFERVLTIGFCFI